MHSLDLRVITDLDFMVPRHVLAAAEPLWSEDGQDVVGLSKLVPADPTKVPPVLGEPVDGSWR
ncbi:MAG: hypothetical protein ACKPEA_01940 [Planctomycetota bacterium]